MQASRRSLLTVWAVSAVIVLLNVVPVMASEQWQWTTLGALKPTQGAIGHRQVEYKLERYRLDREALFDDLCEIQGQGQAANWNAASNPRDIASFSCSIAAAQRTEDTMKTAVRGPGNKLYLTDGHHTFSTFMDMPEGGADFPVLVRITHDQSHLSAADFWQWMQNNGQTWLFNGEGHPIVPTQLANRLGRAALANDELRAGVYFLRGLVWQKPENPPPFLEFFWAQALRTAVPPVHAESRTDYLRWLERLAGALTTAEVSANLAATRSLTAQQNAAQQNTELDSLLCRPTRNGMRFGKLSYLFLASEPAPRCSTGVQFLPELPPQPDSAIKGKVIALVEIAAGSREKWEVSKTGGARLLWDRNVEFAGYPANYGTLPQTYSDPSLGGDGDPLDILILGEPLAAGSLVHVRIVGMMNMLDGGERDEKFIAVLATDPVFGALNDLVDLDTRIPALTAHIQHWFQHYKGQASSVTDLSWHTREEALAVLQGYMRNTE